MVISSIRWHFVCVMCVPWDIYSFCIFNRLGISIEMIYSKKAGEDIPMLSVKDDGQGMTHKEIVRMVSFGHKQPDTDDPDHIGRFGIGFKVLLFVICLSLKSCLLLPAFLK